MSPHPTADAEPATPEVTVGDFYRWSLVVAKGVEAVLRAGEPPPGPAAAVPIDLPDQLGLRVVVHPFDHSVRPPFLAAVQDYHGPDPARTPAFFTLSALSHAETNSPPMPQLVREWRSRVARSQRLTEAVIDSWPLTKFCWLLLTLRQPAGGVKPPTTTTSALPAEHSLPIDVSKFGHVTSEELPSGLREAYTVAYRLVAEAGRAVMIYRELAKISLGQTYFQPASPLLSCPDPAFALKHSLEEIDRLLPAVDRHLAPVRRELVSCRSGWAVPNAPANNVHDTGVWCARLVRGMFDDVSRYITGDRLGIGRHVLPPRELVRRWPQFAAVVLERPDLFDGSPRFLEVLLELSREATLAAAARPGGFRQEPRGDARPDIPEWREQHRRLLFRGVVIRDFSAKRAKNQEGILDTFQAEGWPPAVKPQVKAHRGSEPRPLTGRALADAIDGLNEDMPRGTIRFFGDGTGEGVRWRATDGTPDNPGNRGVDG